MTTVDLNLYQTRIDALCAATRGRVYVDLELKYRHREAPTVTWSVYLAAGSPDGEKHFEGPTLEVAIVLAEHARGLIEGVVPGRLVMP